MGVRTTRAMRRQHHTSGAPTVCSCAAMIVGVLGDDAGDAEDSHDHLGEAWCALIPSRRL